MFRKIFFSCAVIMMSFSLSYSDTETAMAAYPSVYVSTYTVEIQPVPASAVYIEDEDTYMTMGLGTYLTAVSTERVEAAAYYPEQFYEEYFYRENTSEPIRDFRYYGIKTFYPNVERDNTVIRDFRTELWDK